MTIKSSPAMKLKAEAQEAEFVDFEYDGDVYTVPTPKRWPLDAVEAQEAGRLLEFTRKLLGDAQYAKFKEKPRVLEDIERLLDAAISAVADPGK